MQINRAAILGLTLICSIGATKAADPRWSIEVDGMPKTEGSVITRVGFGSRYTYSMASTDVTMSFALAGKNAPARINIKFRETGINCMNFGETTVKIEGDLALVSGAVGCRSADAQPGEHESVSIEGWFDTTR